VAASPERPTPLWSVAFVRISWPRPVRQPCAVAAPQPSYPWTRNHPLNHGVLQMRDRKYRRTASVARCATPDLLPSRQGTPSGPRRLRSTRARHSHALACHVKFLFEEMASGNTTGMLQLYARGTRASNACRHEILCEPVVAHPAESSSGYYCTSCGLPYTVYGTVSSPISGVSMLTLCPPCPITHSC
jgi:hypothetical protein